MENNEQETKPDCETLLKDARERIQHVEARMKNAKSRAELAESRSELAEARTALAETRAALAEARAEQAETALQGNVPNGIHASGARKRSALARLNSRQREILRLIAEGQNTKQIAEVLTLSPKTVEYHRAKLMRALELHDIPSLVRLAVRAGLVPSED